MTAGKVGMPKLNIPKAKASPKAAIANNLRTSTPGASYGIFAQRSLTGSGIHLNNRLFNSASISATRHALNDNRVALFNNIGMPHRCNHNNGDNTMNKFMAGMMAMNMMAQLTAQTMKTINEAKAAKADKADDTKKTDGPSSPTNSTVTSGGSNPTEKTLSLSGKLKASTSFNDIKNVETELGTKLTEFGSEYKKLETTGRNDIKSALNTGAEGLELVDLNADTIAEGLSVTDLSSLILEGNLDAALEQIDKDNEGLAKYKKDTIGGAKSKVSQGIQSRKGQLTRAEANLQSAETTLKGLKEGDPGYDVAKQNYETAKAEVEKLEKEIKKLEDAKTALEAAEEKVDALEKDIKTQKSELNDLKKTKEDLAKTKYELAKSQLETLNKNAKTMKALNDEINSLIGKTDEKSVNKLRDKINDYNELVPSMAQAYNSLTSLQADEIKDIKDAKGNPIKMPSSFEAYAQYITPKQQVSSSVTSGVDGNNGIAKNAQVSEANSQLMKNIDECTVPYQTITFGNASYTLLPNGNFKSDEGKEFTRDQLQRIINNDRSNSNLGINFGNFRI